MQFASALVIYKQDHAGAKSLGHEISAWLEARGLSARLCEAGAAIGDPPDLAIALGGDGTIIGAARKLAGSRARIMGVNFGRVGFLTLCDPDSWRQCLEKALAGELSDRACLALQWRLERGGMTIDSGVAINDVVVARGCLARLTSLAIRINSTQMGELRSDGVIIASPLGSAGYSASAGGPALDPALSATGLTPICPFASGISPLVFPGKTEYALTALDISGDCYLTIDGQEGRRLEKRDTVIVNGWPDAVHFLGEEAVFLARLKKRAFTLLRSNL